MNIDTVEIDSILKTVTEVIETAQNVNKQSYVRKQITSETLMLLTELSDKNSMVISNYNQVFSSLQNYISGITRNRTTFKTNIDLFKGIIESIDLIKNRLIDITSKISDLIKIVDTIKKDTEEINTLATNATIVSSKYNTSVFQILSAKLNNLTQYINQNLEHIITFVSPIKDSIDNLKNINLLVIKDIESGYHNFLLFLEKFGHQENVVDKQVQKAELSREKIESQKDMLADINTQVYQMDSDAGRAIEGSGNVMKIGESLKTATEMLLSSGDNNKTIDEYIKTIEFITEQGATIWATAKNVNARSKSQLVFSYSSLEFCKSIIKQSEELGNTVNIFNKQSIDNNQLAMKIGVSIKELLNQLLEIENRIVDSNKTLKKFIDDYLTINNIIDILKTILKLMKIIGIYSRIEASRDPVAYEGFLTISKNIQKLQNKIRNTLPKIEGNIKETKVIIDQVNESYKNISTVFTNIRKNSITFTNELNEISQISTEAENISKLILDESLNLQTLLSDLENYLNKLTEVVQVPIEGSAKNIKRGKLIESKGSELKKTLLQ